MLTRNRVLSAIIFFLLIWGCFGRTAAVHAYTESDFNATPPFVSASVPPLVMLVMARDDKLYSAAYNDASDLNNDGTLDVGYNPAIDYYGYFDSHTCYQYVSAADPDNSKFEPESTTTDKKCSGHVGRWSGDWLNYVTMSRMDTLRKVLYGGYRSVDTATETVLRRTYIPQDAHTWGKSYESVDHDGYDISEYTPLDVPVAGRHLFANTTLSDNGTPLLRVLPNNIHQIWDWVAKERPEGDDSLESAGGNYNSHPGDHSEFDDLITAFATSGHLLGTLTSTTTPSVTQIDSDANGTSNNMPFTNAYDGSSNHYLDVVKGDLEIHTAGSYTFAVNGDDAVEVLIDGNVIVGWYGGHGKETVTLPGTPPTHTATLTLTAGTHSIEFHHQETSGEDNYYLYWNGPDSGSSWEIVRAYIAGGGGLNNLTQSFYDVHTPASTITDYTVQVKVCDSSMPEQSCKQYPDGDYKPVGILQRRGESDSMYFGLMTGSYMKNLSGGVLRKNVGSIRDEINTTTDGTFTSVNGIIGTIDKLRVYGYGYPAEGYNYYYYQDCGWITDRPIEEGECRMWGNPIGEMMYETIRYFSGTETPTPSFTYDYSDTSLDDNVLGLPHPDWIDPYDVDNGGYPRCSKPFMLVLSDVNPSFDSNSIPGADSNFGSVAPVTIGSSSVESPLTGPELNVKDLADFISTQEGITSGSYYIGQHAGDYDSVCSAKDITGFGDIRGLCPEDPSKQGSYYSAAVAYYAHIHDISATADDDQKVTTYAVGLASPLPRVEIPVGDKTITLVPFGKSVGGCYYTDLTEGAFQPTENIADFFVSSIGTTSGEFRINYEDVEQGADHDQDALVVYQYQLVDDSNNPVTDAALGTKVKITLTSTAAAGCVMQHMGYIISGTTADGSYLDVRDADTASGDDPDYFLDTPPGEGPGGAWSDGTALPLTSTRYFTPGTTGASPAQILKNPLWYAAKYGGFTERPANAANTLDGNNIPDQTSEWDSNGDGSPETYFYVTNPLYLEEQLNKSFADILRRVSSGSAASVISNSKTGEGAVYQSVFFPENMDVDGNEVSWVGDIHSLFIDQNGNLREDTNGNHQLDVVNNPSANGTSDAATTCGDLIVVFDTNTENHVVVSKFADCNGNSILDTTEDTDGDGLLDHGEVDTNGNGVLDTYDENTVVASGTIDDVNYLWKAGSWLNNLTDPTTQRTAYSPTLASDIDLDRRYVFTFIDSHDSKQYMVPQTSSEQQAFSCPSLPSTADLTDRTKIFPYLNVYAPFETSAPSFIESIRESYPTAFDDFLKQQSCREINYIRGQDQDQYVSTTTPSYTIPAFRSRQFEYNSDSIPVTWRLGDIVYSSPTLVGRPAEAINLLYEDRTYATFLNKYYNRRHVVYVGGNDGMIHAFNAGFYDDAKMRFTTRPLLSTDPVDVFDTTYAPFALGAELWAYVPFNLLPHLYWLTDPDYAHVYYIDQKPRVFDARIFLDDHTTTNIHPGGWGTVMVVGMRLGGGTVDADMDKTDGMAVNPDTDLKMSSAYVVFDITDPEQPPKVLAELKFPGLGYTTCYPTAFAMSQTGATTLPNTSTDGWYLVFGSGPAESDGRAGKNSETSLKNVASAQSAKIYMVDLKKLAGYDGSTPQVVTLTGDPPVGTPYSPDGYQNGITGYYKAFDTDSFISDPISVDYDFDFKADAVYFGTVIGNPGVGLGAASGTTWSGKLRQIVINGYWPTDTSTAPSGWVSDSVLLDTESLYQPITAAVNATIDTSNNRWVYIGTGRFFVRTDTDASDQQSYYGIKEKWDCSSGTAPNSCTWETVSRDDLLNVTNAMIYDDRTVAGITGPSGPVTTWYGLTSLVEGNSEKGWKYNFSTPLERNIGQASLLGSTLLFTTYIPSEDICAFEGISKLYGFYYTTGTPFPTSIFSTTIPTTPGPHLVPPSIDVPGLVLTPPIITPPGGTPKVVLTSSSGALITKTKNTATNTRSGVKAWRLYEP